MAADPYTILGVPRSASEAELKSAYRKLAKKLHPDMNPGRKDIETKFKEVTAAYDLLSDPDKRARFDRGEIDGQGQERGFSRGGYGSYGGGARSQSSRGPFGFTGGFNPEDIFAEFFGGGGAKRGAHQGQYHEPPERGGDVNYEITIPFTEACLGGTQRVTLAGGKTVDVNIPPGTESGHKLRLRGQGAVGAGGTGDAIVEIKVAPHPHFTREGHTIHLEVPISLAEAALGGTIKVPTLGGTVALKIHKGANTGTIMRLKGKGVPRKGAEAGDMLVKLKILLPDDGVGDLASAIEKWAKKHAYDPRKKLGWG